MTTPDPRSTTTTDPEAAAFAGMYGGGMYGGMYPGMFGDYGGYYDGEDENEQVRNMSFAAKKKKMIYIVSIYRIFRRTMS